MSTMPSGTSSSPDSARIQPVFDLQSPSFDASIHSVLLLLSPQRPFLRLSTPRPTPLLPSTITMLTT
uniref:Uncharacterized protein n=1 Tax=Triticum urartu TaxID=4572 RepID=A0A8R7K053_TRIUA